MTNTNLTDDTQFSTNNYSYVFNSHRKENWTEEGRYMPSYSYYSWDAATLGSGRSIETENTDAPYSICPKGWKLPTSGSTSDNGWKRGDFYALATTYGADLENDYYDYNYYNNDVIMAPGTIPNFQYASNYSNGYFEYEGAFGVYWSSTSSSSADYARAFAIDSGISVASEFDRYYGNSVRCLFSD